MPYWHAQYERGVAVTTGCYVAQGLFGGIKQCLLHEQVGTGVSRQAQFGQYKQAGTLLACFF